MIVDALNAALAGRYQVERELGAGGMATVYLARDLRHDRQVAVKVLHPDLAAALGAERFLAEIKTTANLQHPHILPLHDSGEAGGYLFYVMPFVAGETLRARLERERVLPIADAVRIAREVLSALDYAHRHGVIHRDIKPENILLHEGSALVADFGIALAVQTAGGQRMTQTGLSLGTPQYMSPEQAMGERQIDGRADIYAVGAVLYETLTGEPPFFGASVQAIVAKVMTERPTSPRTVRDTIPPSVEASVLQALAKMPADRFATAAQFADALGDDRASYAAFTSTSLQPERRRTPRQRLLSAISIMGALVIAAALGALLIRVTHHEGPVSVAHFEFAAPESVTIHFEGTAVALSPDDQVAAFVGFRRGVTRLYTRRLDELAVRELAGTEGAVLPIFSPSGRWIAFEALGGKLVKVDAAGGVPVAIGVTTSQTGLDWIDDDAIVVGSDQTTHHGLIRIGAGGGASPVQITHPDSAHGVVEHLWPVVDATHRLILLTLHDGQSNLGSRIGVTSIDGGKVDDIGVQGIAPLGIVGDQLIFVRADGAVMAIGFDASRRKTSGGATPVVDPVPVCATCNGDAAVRVSRRGSLIALRGVSTSRLRIVSANGASRLLEDRWQPISPWSQFSPDGSKIAVPIASTGDTRTQDIWVYDATSGAKARVTSVRGIADGVNWTPDGKRLVYRSSRPGGAETAIVVQAAAGDTPPTRIGPAGRLYSEGALSPDGRHAAILVFRDGRNRLDTLSIGSDHLGDFGDDNVIVASGDLKFSPDGRWLAYAGVESGRPTVYVRPFPGPGPALQLSDSSAMVPRWLANNRVAYRDGSRIIAATIDASPSPRVVSKQTLFADFKQPADRLADIGPGGDRLLILETTDRNITVEVILNWAQALRDRASRK